MKTEKRYTTGEEIFNAVSHGVGAGLSAAALPILAVKASGVSAMAVVSTMIYGFTLIFLYMMSTLYHSLTNRKAKEVFGRMDHTSIYALIAGTYTPFCLMGLKGALGWTIFGIIWGTAAAGITFYAIFGSRIRKLSALTYIPMAWLILLTWKKLAAGIPPESLRLLLYGGICYTAGTVFYALKKIRWMHSVFHLFVLAGSILHFFSVLRML